MLITFRSNACADVVMLDKHALSVLKAAGRDYETLPESGVFTVGQLEEAIQNIVRSVAEDPDSNPDQAYADKDREVEDDEYPDEKPHPVLERVTLRRRTFPLLDMLRAAKAQGKEVVWEAGSAW
ncbi:DUF1840 domain-containing protein [Advenella sp. RU8]|uniref:DUF1840 domain-containing protein n=1 Tax=Advenella sp. RU8 TaxID=3399575 RepID=UPI003AAC886F